MSHSYDVIVIGAGANGLTAGALLGRAGLRVLVLEAHEAVGGLARVCEFAPGFRSPWFGGMAGFVSRGLEHELAAAGGGGLERRATAATVVLEPGTCLTLGPEVNEAAAAIRRFDERDAAAWPAFASRVRALASFLEALYQAPPPDIDASSLTDVLPLISLGRRFRGLGRSGMIDLLRALPMSVQQLVEESFGFEPLQTLIAARGVRDSRLGPRAGGTGFLLLHGLAGAPPGAIGGPGVWVAGPDAYTQTAERAARGAGVTIRTETPVARITVRDDAVAGVVLETGEEIGAGCILSSADPARTLLGLVDPVWLDPEFLLALRNLRFRGCTAAVLYALDALPDTAGTDSADLLRGSVSLTAGLDVLERGADDVKYGRIADAPHIELTAPSLHWPQLAPPDHHIVAARVQYAPRALRAGDWTPACATTLADRVTAAIDAAFPCFSSRVLHRAVLTPDRIEREFGLTEGALTHGELMLDQILFMRPLAGWSRYATPIEGLYLCGAGAHPGPGIPGGSGRLAARRVLLDRKRRKNTP